ncbi:hypothetical protein [Streptomyces angustmyceticus]|uniref:hypothetical protein n=1 Tax=Streptomyces angustmyceticus TaxID=285578 RepID=UPI00344BA611
MDPLDQHLADSIARAETDGVLDQLIAANDQMLAALHEVIDVEAGLQQILDRAKEA